MADNNIEQYANDSIIDVTQPIKINTACIKVGSEIWGTLGNFSAIVGKPKARKSFLLLLALAASIRNKPEGLITVDLPKEKPEVLFFDTEQSPNHIHRAIERIIKMSGNIKQKVITTRGLRKYDTATRLKIIEHVIYKDPQNASIIVIDGIRDLISSINDESDATMITSKLLKWTEELNIHVIIVIHSNKNDDNPRGHVGSEIQNKAETIITVTKDKLNSTVKCEFARDKEFDKFIFTINEEGLPVIIGQEEAKTKNKKAKNPEDLSTEQHQDILGKVFKLNSKPIYNELIKNVQLVLKSLDMPAGLTKAKEFKKFFSEANLIEEVEISGKYPYYLVSANK